jgi:hypothetical protein
MICILQMLQARAFLQNVQRVARRVSESAAHCCFGYRSFQFSRYRVGERQSALHNVLLLERAQPVGDFRQLRCHDLSVSAALRNQQRHCICHRTRLINHRLDVGVGLCKPCFNGTEVGDWRRRGGGYRRHDCSQRVETTALIDNDSGERYNGLVQIHDSPLRVLWVV